MMLLLDNIHKSFADGNVPVLKGVSLSLCQGDFCVLVGANGSGKSTLMKIISGEYTPDCGKVLIDGKPYGRGGFFRPVAEVSQDVNQGTLPQMTLFENLVISQRLPVSPLRFYRQFMHSLERQFNAFCPELVSFMHKPLSVLSGGQRQRVATLMAMMSRPKILLLDEHTSALDPRTSQSLMTCTETYMRTTGQTAVMITHRLTDAIRYGNRLVMLREGAIVLDVAGEEKSRLQPEALLSLFHEEESHVQ